MATVCSLSSKGVAALVRKSWDNTSCVSWYSAKLDCNVDLQCSCKSTTSTMTVFVTVGDYMSSKPLDNQSKLQLLVPRTEAGFSKLCTILGVLEV